MPTLLWSHLSVEECIACLEKAKKQDDIPFSRDYLPPYGKIMDNTFSLQVNIGRYLPYMYGNFSKSAEGTLVTCSMEVSRSTRKFNFLWLFFALPFFLFLVVFGIFDAIKNGYSITHLVMIAMGIVLPSLKWYMQRISKRRFEADERELLNFLKTTLNAKEALS